MQFGKTARKILQFLSTGGTTLSGCLLSFVGVSAIASSPYAIAAVIFVLGFEWQVNEEGNRNSFKFLLDRDSLKLSLAEKYLDGLSADNAQSNNIFNQNYQAKKNYFHSLKKEIASLTNQRHSLLRVYEAKKRDELLLIIRAKKQELKKIKKELRQLKLFFLKKIMYPVRDSSASKWEKAIADLSGEGTDALKKEIARKGSLIRTSWLLSIMSGMCSGLSTLSAVQSGAAVFDALNDIPFGWILGLSIFASVGYTLVIQDTMNKVIQKYKKGWVAYYQKRENESTFMHTFRCIVLASAILLAFAATLATAGTWFNLVNHGAKTLGVQDETANRMRDILMVGMVTPNIVYNIENSMESLNKIFKKNIHKWLFERYNEIAFAFQHENFIRFCNPPRIALQILRYAGKGFLFLCHVTSIGAGSDRIKLDFIPALPPISPEASIIVVGGNEAVTDGNYLPDEEGLRKHSRLLSALFLLVDIPVDILKMPACVWDYIFSGDRNFRASFEKIFLTQHEEPLISPWAVEPELPPDWYDQTLVEFFDDTINRMEHENYIQRKFIYQEEKTIAKISAVKTQKADVARGFIDQEAAMQSVRLNRCRFMMWHWKETDSEAGLNDVFENHPFFSVRAGV